MYFEIRAARGASERRRIDDQRGSGRAGDEPAGRMEPPSHSRCTPIAGAGLQLSRLVSRRPRDLPDGVSARSPRSSKRVPPGPGNGP